MTLGAVFPLFPVMLGGEELLRLRSAGNPEGCR